MLIIPAIVESLTSRKDKTYIVRIASNELTPQKVGELSAHLQKFCFVAFQADEFKTEEIEVLESLESDYENMGKTLSQRQRAVLFVIWKQDNKGFKNFNSYYEFRMNGNIEKLKAEIDG
jgi:hypothetical protein